MIPFFFSKIYNVCKDILSYSGSYALTVNVTCFSGTPFSNLLLFRFGVSKTTLDWFRSYFMGRSQFVYMDGFRSVVGPVSTGVPQGSVLGPLLLSIYIYPLSQILRALDLSYYFYADDTDLYTFQTWSIS